MPHWAAYQQAGIGTPESEVTQSGGGPCAFVASQFGGNAGGITASNFRLGNLFLTSRAYTAPNSG